MLPRPLQEPTSEIPAATLPVARTTAPPTLIIASFCAVIVFSRHQGISGSSHISLYLIQNRGNVSIPSSVDLSGEIIRLYI